ncbi:MAG: signal transduction histidine kinase [Phenylobacterium sp.]|jgi:signal transduction histidine kinase
MAELKPSDLTQQAQVNQLEQQVKQLTAQLDTRDKQLVEANQQLHQMNLQVEDKTADLFMLEELGRYLTSSLALDEVISNVYHSFSVLDTDVFLLGLLNHEDHTIHMPFIMNQQKNLATVDVSLSDNNSPAVWCILNKAELVIFEAKDQFKYFNDPMMCVSIADAKIDSPAAEEMNSIVYQPLIVGDKIVGCLSVQNLEPHAYNADQLDMIRTLASYSAIAIANAQGYETLVQTHQTLIKTQNQLLLQDKMASLGTLTAGVAHEINNPINFTHISAESLAADLVRFEQFLITLAGDNADQHILDSFSRRFASLFEHIKTIKTGTNRVRTIVQNLRVFTNLDKSEVMPIDINQCLSATIDLITTKYFGIAVFCTDLQPIPELICYPGQLNQAFMNIITNAADAISERHRQQLSAPVGKIEVSCQLQNQVIMISFKDNGCGMSETCKSRLFDPFYTTKDVGHGTGLGMTIVFDIIKDHGGSIDIESREGAYTLVTLNLPLEH